MPKSIPSDKIRISGSKVKTGCRTCKSRRIKCDEGRPACRRCVISRRQCEYDGSHSKNHDHGQGFKFVHYVNTDVPVSSSPQIDIARITICRGLCPSTDLDHLALRSLDFYINSASIQLGGPIGISTFSTGLSRLMYSDAAVRHCLVALAAFQESLADGAKGAMHQQQRELAVLHYNKSIKAVLEMSRGNSEQAAVITITTCLLYCAIEIVQGHLTSAIRQIEAGLRLLAQNEALLYQQEQNNLGVAAGYVDSLKCLFLGLGAQAREIQDAELGSTELSIISALSSRPITNYNFANTEQALSNLARFEDDMLMLMGWISMEYHATDFPSFDLQQTKQRLDLQLSLRKEAYNRLLEARLERSPEQSQADTAALLILRIHQITNKIDLAMAFETKEIAFDSFVQDFAEITTLSEQFLMIDSRRKDIGTNQPSSGENESSPWPMFTLSIGVIPSLFFTAARCRDPTVRRKALSLLQNFQRRESVWDTRVVAIVAERLIDLEETAAKQCWIQNYTGVDANKFAIGTAADVPESIRLSEMQIQCGATEEYAEYYLQEQAKSCPDENFLVWNAEDPEDCFVLSNNPFLTSLRIL